MKNIKISKIVNIIAFSFIIIAAFVGFIGSFGFISNGGDLREAGFYASMHLAFTLPGVIMLIVSLGVIAVSVISILSMVKEKDNFFNKFGRVVIIIAFAFYCFICGVVNLNLAISYADLLNNSYSYGKMIAYSIFAIIFGIGAIVISILRILGKFEDKKFILNIIASASYIFSIIFALCLMYNNGILACLIIAIIMEFALLAMDTLLSLNVIKDSEVALNLANISNKKETKETKAEEVKPEEESSPAEEVKSEETTEEPKAEETEEKPEEIQE